MHEVSPDDLGLDVPARFDDLAADVSEVAVDADEIENDVGFDPRDADDLADQRDAALDGARQALDEMPLGRASVDWARDHVLGAMRAEYLRRQYGGL